MLHIKISNRHCSYRHCRLYRQSLSCLYRHCRLDRQSLYHQMPDQVGHDVLYVGMTLIVVGVTSVDAGMTSIYEFSEFRTDYEFFVVTSLYATNDLSVYAEAL